jgi:ABC-type bacteriocin/lantibiotic exporter with double-glycine peptidase domain
LRVSMERTGEVFRLPLEKPKLSAAVKALQGEVQFRNVTFSYPGNNKPALTDFSLDIRPGQKVALVGRSGSGKTTLASLLAALYEPSTGSILFDNTDQRDFDRAALRRQIGVVEQHPYIFNGSIRENIAKANPDASLEDIVAAASLAGAHTFINDLPMGYETQIGERGITLSGGQRQRLVIARTLLNQPPILILDEATSALDTVTESIVQQNLDRVSKGRTTFVIAHRLSTVRNADMIVVIDEGRLVEKGTHDELTALRGTYHHLYSRSA